MNLREVFGDECAVEDCPYERHEDSQFCAYHMRSPRDSGYPEPDEEDPR